MKRYLILFSALSLGIALFSCKTEPNPIPTEVSFKNNVEKIIKNSCAIPGCHISGGEKPELTDYETISYQIEKGNPNASHIYQSITGANGHELMPYKRDRLPEDQRQIIFQWILQGGKNN